MKTYEIDGANFSDISGFYDEVSAKLIPGAAWGKNLDAFNDILSGGFGTPEEGFELVWNNSETSKTNLGDTFDAIVGIIHNHQDITLKLE